MVASLGVPIFRVFTVNASKNTSFTSSFDFFFIYLSPLIFCPWSERINSD